MNEKVKDPKVHTHADLLDRKVRYMLEFDDQEHLKLWMDDLVEKRKSPNAAIGDKVVELFKLLKEA